MLTVIHFVQLSLSGNSAGKISELAGFLIDNRNSLIIMLSQIRNEEESFRVKDVTHLNQRSKAERTAGSNADAGYELARSFAVFLLIELEAQFHTQIRIPVKWSIRVLKVSRLLYRL